MHQVHHQNGEIAQIRPPRPQIGEGLMPRGVNDLETRNLQALIKLYIRHLSHILRQFVLRKVSRPNLLSNAPSLPSLHIRMPQLIQNQRLARIHMPQNTQYWTPQFSIHILVVFPTPLPLPLILLIPHGPLKYRISPFFFLLILFLRLLLLLSLHLLDFLLIFLLFLLLFILS